MTIFTHSTLDLSRRHHLLLKNRDEYLVKYLKEKLFIDHLIVGGIL
jgi:hypothetical protein